MINCTRCKSELLETASFCAACGQRNTKWVLQCVACKLFSPPQSPRCYHCGTWQNGKAFELDPPALFILDLTRPDTFEDQIETLFYKSLRERVAEDLPQNTYDPFVTASFEPVFRKQFQSESIALSDQLFELVEQKKWRMLDQNAMVHNFMQTQIGRLFSGAGASLLAHPLLEASFYVRHNAPLADVVTAYLSDPVLANFLHFLPANDDIGIAVSRFYNPLVGENILLALDFSLARNFSEGLIISTLGVYWRTIMGQAERVWHHELSDLRIEKNWLRINGKDLDMGAVHHLRMLYLLRHIRYEFSV